MTTDAVTVTKKGRKTISSSGKAMTQGQRQRRSRSMAIALLLEDKQSEISLSGLVSLLPNLISEKKGTLVKTVCDEITRRCENLRSWK